MAGNLNLFLVRKRNEFLAFKHRRPISSLTWQYVKTYCIRFIACLSTMELILHFMYVVAIKDTSAWRGDSPFELSMIGFWNLIIVWLKVRIIVGDLCV